VKQTYRVEFGPYVSITDPYATGNKIWTLPGCGSKRYTADEISTIAERNGYYNIWQGVKNE